MAKEKSYDYRMDLEDILGGLDVGGHPGGHLLPGHLAVQLALHGAGQILQGIGPQPGVDAYVDGQGKVPQSGAAQHPPQIHGHRDLGPTSALGNFGQSEHGLEHHGGEQGGDGAMVPVCQGQHLCLWDRSNGQVEEAVLLPGTL